MKTSDFLGNEWEIDCMGCAISAGRMIPPGGMIRRTPHFCVHQDPLVPLPGFLVIAACRHIRSISEMHADEFEEFSRLTKSAHQAIKDTIDIPYLTIVQEESSVHFHLWFFPWAGSLIARYGVPSLTKIRDIMAEYRGQPVRTEEWDILERSIGQIKALMK